MTAPGGVWKRQEVLVIISDISVYFEFHTSFSDPIDTLPLWQSGSQVRLNRGASDGGRTISDALCMNCVVIEGGTRTYVASAKLSDQYDIEVIVKIQYRRCLRSGAKEGRRAPPL